MQWLLHGNLTPAVADALKRHGHLTHGVEELELLPDAPAMEIVKAANTKQFDIITTDARLVEAPFDNKYWFGRSIVYLQLGGGDVEQDDAIERLFVRHKRLTPRRLYTVTGSRVKVRQLPGRMD